MRSNKDILEYLIDTLSEMFEIEKDDITLESKLYEDLDIDSIDAVDLVVRLKDVTGKKILPEDFKNVRTIADVVTAIEELQKNVA
ncbi:MAG TPA: acyl carrier protein [Dehalococcoidia bacterium]|nr:acyl carrier protein [Dehalococcoidia bacterium]